METCYLTTGLITKRARVVAARRPVAAVHPSQRVAIKRLRARMAHVVYGFFLREAPKMAGQVIVLRGRQHFVAKADLSRDEVDSLNKLIADLDFSGWSILAGQVDDIIEAAVKDGAAAAFIQTGVGTNADREMLNIVNREALDYAQARSAEMVGMRRVAGHLIPNPNAKWQITESTRDFIRGEVQTAMVEGWSNDVLATKIADSYGFSSTRAMVIARTETIRASNEGSLASYRAAGVEEKEWTTAEDDKVSEECVANGAQGAIPIGDAFESGDEIPPAHPNCRCTIVPVVHFASEGKPAAPVAPVAAPVPAVLAPIAPAREVPNVKWFGDTSMLFRAAMQRAMDSFPNGVMRRLARHGTEIHLGERVTQISPELKGVHPRGWPAGTTWDSADGFQRQGRIIATAETYRPIGSKRFVSDGAARSVGVLAHETGHGLDYTMAKASRTPEFLKAYTIDARTVRAAQRASATGARPFSYYLQRGEAGPSEAFAEVFAQVVTNGTGSNRHDIRAAFPNVTRFIEKLLAELERGEP